MYPTNHSRNKIFCDDAVLTDDDVTLKSCHTSTAEWILCESEYDVTTLVGRVYWVSSTSYGFDQILSRQSSALNMLAWIFRLNSTKDWLMYERFNKELIL